MRRVVKPSLPGPAGIPTRLASDLLSAESTTLASAHKREPLAWARSVIEGLLRSSIDILREPGRPWWERVAAVDDQGRV